MTVSVPPRNAWLEWLKNIAGAVVVTGALGASAVIAASESQQPMPGNAIVVLCGAVGRCQGAMSPDASVPRDAVVQSLAHPDP
jgi:Ni,Fe-hydrogenase III small subunit